jgi:hypothetical protein
MDRIAGEISTDDPACIKAEIEKIRESFIQEQGLYELYQQCSEPLKCILVQLSIYPNPIVETHIQEFETKITSYLNWKELLRYGMDLSLVEYEPANKTYNVTPLLKEKLKIEYNNKKK